MKWILGLFGLIPGRKQLEPDTLLPSGIQLWTHFYHMTHNRNLEGILRHGILAWSRAHSEGLIEKDISDLSVQQRRNRPEPVFKQSIHDYAPLYLNPKNPMLYVRKHIQHEIVILFISPTVLDNRQHVFTNGNAAAGATQFSRDRSVVAESETVLLAPRWAELPDGKRRRCAEVLVYQSIPARYIVGAVCSNETLRRRVAVQCSFPVAVDASFFF
jgi:hypothetical protein